MLKTGSKTVQRYTPKAEEGVDNPTSVCFIPMTKAQYDEYTDKLFTYRRNKVISNTSRSGQLVFELCLAPDEDGVFIYNTLMDEKTSVISNIKDKKIAVQFLCGLADVDTANEIEQRMRGSSTLEVDEEKNSGGR